MLDRLKRVPLSVARGLGRLLARITRVTAIAGLVVLLLIALDALFLPDDADHPESDAI